MECSPRTSTSRPCAAAARTRRVYDFLACPALTLLQSSTGSAFCRRCAGLPHAPRAVVPSCARPRLAPAPTPAHLLAHFGFAAVLSKSIPHSHSNCCSCCVCRWDLRQQIQSFEGTTRSRCFRYVARRPASRSCSCCRFAPRERTCCAGWLPTVCARAHSGGRLYLRVHVMD